MVRITAVRMYSGSNDHEAIAAVQWVDVDTAAVAVSTKDAMVSWLRQGGSAVVGVGHGAVRVGVVDAVPPYIRTHADGKWTNNLLALPRF